MLYQLIKMFVITYLRMVLSVRVKGLENIPKNGSAILIANHPSTLDGFLLLSVLERDFHVFVNSRFFENKLRLWFLKTLKAIPVDARRDNRHSLIKAERKLTENNFLLIFPEGKVNDGNDVLQFKNSFVHLGANAKVPVIPIVIYGSHIVMKDKKFFPSRGKVYINILPPVVLNCKANSLEKENAAQISKDIRNMMIGNLEELKGNLKKYGN